MAAKLGGMGLGVEDVPRTKGYDLLVNGEIRVALRVAFPGRYAHTVTVGGKRYTYNYKSWSFNFHRHGRWDRKYCDVFVCIAKRRSGTRRGLRHPGQRRIGSDLQPARRRHQAVPRPLRALPRPLERLHREPSCNRCSSRRRGLIRPRMRRSRPRRSVAEVDELQRRRRGPAA